MSAGGLYAQNFGNSQIALASVLVLIAVGLSKFLKLDLEKDFTIAALRTTVQLVAVGYVLRWILNSNSWQVNVVVLLVMTLVAGQAVFSRLKHKSGKNYVAALIALLGSVWPLGFISLDAFFSSAALEQTSFFIPYMGVLMGNALSAISLGFVGLERVRGENMLEIATFKALGASSFEACRRVYRDILRSALTPTLNSMTVVGLVSLPGVMAGQLIGGVDPLTAARFQILVMFLVLLTSMTGSLFAIILNHFYFMPIWLTQNNSAMTFAENSEEKLALIGPSGIGKSRLLKSLSGLDDIHIQQNATKSSMLALKEAKGAVAYIHQRAHFIPGTVEDNLKWPYQFKKHQQETYNAQQISEWLEELGLPGSILTKSATTLSGGEGQILHLLRSLQFHPKIIFLDEPTSSLDPQRTLLVESFLNNWLKTHQAQMVFISHNEEQTKRWATKVFVMNESGISPMSQGTK
ncbi:MAG: ABC transporter permease [Bacillota bacterium]